MNLRVLKKDVTYMAEEFISDLLICSSFTEDENKLNKADELYYAAANLHNETIDSIKGWKKIIEDKKQTRAYFRKLYKSFLENLDALYEELSKLMSKKAE